MAYGYTPTLKEPYVCEKPCTHTDCAANRQLVATPCYYCGDPLGEGAKFAYDRDGAHESHYACICEAVDREIEERKMQQAAEVERQREAALAAIVDPDDSVF